MANCNIMLLPSQIVTTSRYVSKYKELMTPERLQSVLAAAWDAATALQPHVQVTCDV